MTELPACLHRGRQIGQDRWRCTAPSLVVAGGTVSADTCLRHCPLVARPAVPLADTASWPLVSCLMPTRDRPGFAAIAIRQFLAQDYPHAELIIIDDGAVPLSEELVANPRIRYVRLAQARSIGAKRNHACREAQGSILVQWDDDDWHGVSRLSRQVAPLVADEADITGLSQTLLFDLGRLEFWKPSAESFRRLAFAGVHCGTLAFRREVCGFTCYPDASQGEDVAFLRPALAAGCRIVPVPGGADFVYVRHGTNVSRIDDFYRRFGARRIAPPKAVASDLPHYRRLRERIFLPPNASGSTPRPPARGLIRRAEEVNSRGVHRSGWSYAFACLEREVLPLLLDDFVEQSFCYGHRPPLYDRPWIGIFHHPQSLPPFAPRLDHPQRYLATAEFRACQPTLRGAVALSQYHASWLAERLKVPVLTVKHPSASAVPWSPVALDRGSALRLVQIGFYLRNTMAIDQVPPRQGLTRSRLLPHASRSGVEHWERQVALHWRRLGTRRSWPGVTELPCASNDQYDQLLASAIVLTEVFDASANNVVVECIARGTPVVVNRHPAVEEYVGKDYPLFFQEIEQVADLISDRERVIAAHRHLLSRQGPWLKAEVFAGEIGRFCRELAT